MSQDATPKKTNQTSIPSPEEKVKLLQDILENLGSEPSGPIYLGTHKQLAEHHFSSGNEEEAIFHLCESHGTTLRNLTYNKLQRFYRLGKEQQPDVEIMRDTLAFTGEWSAGVSGLRKRLSALPSEWSAIQLTHQWDPLSRFPPRNRNVNRGQGLFLTRFSFGEVSFNNINSQGCVVLPPYDVDEESTSVMTAMMEGLSLMNNRSQARVQAKRNAVHDECSLRVESGVRDLERWVGGWHFLFLGHLSDEKLMSDIKSAVDLHIEAYTEFSLGSVGNKSARVKDVEKNECVSEKVLSWLYLIASNPHMQPAQIYEVLVNLLESKDFALFMSKKIQSLITFHKNNLLLSKRYPVILIIDEDLDMLPFEIMSSLESQAFTRVPSIHFLHALYSIHKSTTLKNGIDLERGYYLINPSKNLPQLENLFESISNIPQVKKWKGVKNNQPQSNEILSELQQSDVFLYCGHGGGNQYLPKDQIEKTRMNAVPFLFGCSSASLDQLGGRVEMYALSYSYLIAGSPSVVGMLWPVLDQDVNAMTKELLSVWCGYDANKTSGDKMPRLDLFEAIFKARKRASRFLNKAAIVVRGLPVSVSGISKL